MTTKMAFNPLPWYLKADGWHPELAPPLDEILSTIADAGYDGVHADIPPGTSPQDYAKLLVQHALQPAPGYFQAAFSNVGERGTIVAAAARIASDHAALGLDRIFLADQMGLATPRLANPAKGIDADPVRLQQLIDGIGAAAEAMIKEGVTPCLHLHVGTWIETVAEANAVLAALPESLLLVGPDSGHISWAGGDPIAFVKQHAGRIGSVHLKDIRRAVAQSVSEKGQDYRSAGAQHLWTEPGRGDLDLDGFLAALGDFDGWYVVEVDIADKPTVAETARVSADWLRPRLEQRST